MDSQRTMALETKRSHPKALWGCGIAYTFERIAYWGAKPLLVLFLTKALTQGGLGIDKAQAAIIASNLGAFTYLAPILGGIIADKWLGSRYCIIIGSILMTIGWSIGYFANSVAGINALIVLVSLGTGLFKGNINTIVGDLYEKDDPLKDMAYSITYSFVNTGVLIGSFLTGIFYVSVFATKDAAGNILTYGFKECYMFAALSTLMCLIIFIINLRFLGEAGKKPNNVVNANSKLGEAEAKRPLTKQEKNRVVVIFALALFSVFFWTFYYQTDTSLLLYVDKYTNYNLFGFRVPTNWSTATLNGFLCVILSPILATIWMKIAKARKGVEITMTQKIALGYVFLALAFLIMAGAEIVRGGDTNPNSSVLWIMSFTLLQTTGEMCFSPLGNSVVSRTAPPKYLSVLMGVWFFATFVAIKASGYVETVITKLGTLQVFIAIPSILLVGAVILLLLNKKITEFTK